MDELTVELAPPGCLLVTLNRPERRNAITLRIWRDLTQIFRDSCGRSDVRAVILTGAGGHFSSGADITEFPQHRTDPASAADYEAAVEACYESLGAIPKPTIAAISGYCVGGGCALAMACDFRVADGSARFGIPASRLGIIYSIRECELLLSCVSLAAAKRLLFSGEIFDAAWAQEAGIIDVLSTENAVSDAARLAESLVRSAPLSIAGMKLTLQSIQQGTLARDAEAITRLQERALDSEDYREGVNAFSAKRPPAFRGR